MKSVLHPLWLAAAALLVVCANVQAIVIRHDTGYASYTARESQFPAVFYLEERQRRRICVATLIHPRWAITAAHCSEETSMLQSLQEGGTHPVRIAGQEVLIDRLVMHPAYTEYLHSGQGQDVDLALLRLSEPLAYPEPVSLYRDRHEQDQVVTLMGWGYFGIGTRGIQLDDGRFRLARNTIHTADERLRFTFDDPRLPGSPALDLEGLPGLGDSGGPALLRSQDAWQLAGVAVGELYRENERPGMYGAVGIYERISLHLEWIEAVISGVTEPHSALSEAVLPVMR